VEIPYMFDADLETGPAANLVTGPAAGSEAGLAADSAEAAYIADLAPVFSAGAEEMEKTPLSAGEAEVDA
jgi:hypothetical protein